MPAEPHFAPSGSSILPTLFGEGYGTYRTQRRAFVASYAANTLVVAMVLWSGHWFVGHQDEIGRAVKGIASEISLLPPAPELAGGGGGGGDRDKLAAPHGSPPKFAHQQITPPLIVVRNQHSLLTAEATVVGPPQIHFPQASMGDPYSAVLATLSNGTGSGGGIGAGNNGGAGPGTGRGVGPGKDAGIGGDAYRPGIGGVTPPRELYAPDPEYSEQARQVKFQGSVLLWMVVGADGRPKDVRVVRSVGLGLDEKALQAVSTWRFEPGRKDGQPVATQINVEVNFRLY
jgi:TonB family protein